MNIFFLKQDIKNYLYNCLYRKKIDLGELKKRTCYMLFLRNIKNIQVLQID